MHKPSSQAGAFRWYWKCVSCCEERAFEPHSCGRSECYNFLVTHDLHNSQLIEELIHTENEVRIYLGEYYTLITTLYKGSVLWSGFCILKCENFFWINILQHCRKAWNIRFRCSMSFFFFVRCIFASRKLENPEREGDTERNKQFNMKRFQRRIMLSHHSKTHYWQGMTSFRCREAYCVGKDSLHVLGALTEGLKGCSSTADIWELCQHVGFSD